MILDASAFLEFLLRTPAGQRLDEIFHGAETIFAPELLDAEILHRLLRMGQLRQLTSGEVEVAVADLRDAPIRRLSHRPLLAEAAHLGAAMSGYDALYAAAAIVLDRKLCTADRRLARTATDQFGIECIVLVADRA